MDPRKLFVDDRLREVCAYCGSSPSTRDHVPSRVLLDEPFPENLPVVEACRSCNESFSQDEEYVACLIECVLCATTNPSAIQRKKIREILIERPLLTAKIQSECFHDGKGIITWKADIERVRNVVLKLARGHLAFDLHVFHFEPPCVLEITPFVAMPQKELNSFESIPETQDLLFPEIGSRAFVEMMKTLEKPWYGWKNVQLGRYRYRIEQTSSADRVLLVISEYLACRVVWD